MLTETQYEIPSVCRWKYGRRLCSSKTLQNCRTTLRFIPTFFKHFPSLHNKAIDGVFDLCEDESALVGSFVRCSPVMLGDDTIPVGTNALCFALTMKIRQSAIKSLPSLCKDGPQHTIKIADVLCQLLQLGMDHTLIEILHCNPNLTFTSDNLFDAVVDEQDLGVVHSALQTLLIQSPRGNRIH
jgi:hypothetical protein